MVISFALASLLMLLIVIGSRRPRNFPPGPRGLPLVGYLPYLSEYDSRYRFKSLKKLGDIYGPVVGFYLGPTQPFISVCGYEACKAALNNDDLNGRIDNAFVRSRSFDKRLGLLERLNDGVCTASNWSVAHLLAGFLYTDGDQWQEQRRFFLRHLRDLGFGLTSSENMIQEEISYLIDKIKGESESSEDGLVNFQSLFNPSMVNILWAHIGGERFEHDDPNLKQLIEAVNAFFRNGNSTRAGIPVPRFLVKRFPSIRKFIGLDIELLKPIQKFIRDSIFEHQKDRLKDGPRDLINVYLNEVDKRNDASTFEIDQLIVGAQDLFFAGAETTANAIGFLLLYSIHHPEVQRQVQKELDEVCGDALPQLAHRHSLPFTEATLMESLRIMNVSPLTVSHRAMRDTQLLGYFIPKDTVAFINLYSVHMEQSYWKDPHVFRPERHLDSNGKLIKTDHYIPFGIGKRMCLGESLARNSFFLFATALLKSFEFRAATNQPLPTLDPIFGITSSYEGFDAIVHSRH